MIHVVTITQADGVVRVIPVDADDTIDACVRAGRFLPFVTVDWSATVELQSAADCIEHAELFDKLVTDAYGELCDKSDGNDYVTNEALLAGTDEYGRAWHALRAAKERCDECGGAIVGGCCDNCMGADI